MKLKIILLVLILSITTIIAQNPVLVEINAGKNMIVINETISNLYASDLISLYPQIESISVNRNGESFGYVNTLGGVGSNIIIEPKIEYEIYSKENITIEINN